MSSPLRASFSPTALERAETRSVPTRGPSKGARCASTGDSSGHTPLLLALFPQGEIEQIADDHERDDGKMGGRLRVHTGNGSPLLIDQGFVFCRPAQTADETVDLAAAQQWIEPRRHHTGAAAAEFELVFVLPEHIPGLHTGIAGTQADGITHIAE